MDTYCSYKHTYNVVAYEIVLVSNYWLETVSCVKQEKAACLCSNSEK